MRLDRRAVRLGAAYAAYLALCVGAVKHGVSFDTCAKVSIGLYMAITAALAWRNPQAGAMVEGLKQPPFLLAWLGVELRYAPAVVIGVAVLAIPGSPRSGVEIAQVLGMVFGGAAAMIFGIGAFVEHFRPRLGLFDVLILDLLAIIGYFSTTAAARLMGGGFQSHPWLVVAGSLGLPLLAASPVYRALGLRPLCMPLCPHCRKRPFRLAIHGGGQGQELVSCGECGGRFELWHRAPAGGEASSELPAMVLRWPQFFGRWARL